MKYISDRTGRFSQRPHFDPSELDQECEQIITDFMNQSCGGFKLPIPTDAFTKLIEKDADDLDMYADLSGEGADVHGVTLFAPNKKPVVRIAQELSNHKSEHRLRTTLTHEYGHVRFHAPLFAVEFSTPGLFDKAKKDESPKCKRDAILEAPEYNWMEWQAGYICGSLLMPLTAMRNTTREYLLYKGLDSPLQTGSAGAIELIQIVHNQFQVSEDAARVRLIKLGTLTSKPVTKSLF